MRYEKREAYQYSPEELDAIERDIDAEERRGAQPRYWEDVDVGDAMGHVVKGPLCITDMICYYKGRGSPYVANEIAARYRRRHPADAYVDPSTGLDDQPHRGHWEDFMAHQIGVPGAYDLGYHRIACLSTPMMNWVGDDGFVKKLYGEIRRFNVEGDTQWFKAKVTKKYVEGKEHLVDCEVWAVNQNDIMTTPGRATVVLPSREDKDYIVPC